MPKYFKIARASSANYCLAVPYAAIFIVLTKKYRQKKPNAQAVGLSRPQAAPDHEFSHLSLFLSC